MSDLKLNSLESLWRSYQLRLANEPDLSIQDYAAEHPEFQDEIRKLFPMLKDLSEFAKDPIGHPQQIGPYKIVRQIGIGGMGVVYEGTSESLRQRVAIKVVEASLIAGRAIERLEQEARLVAALHHSNIVPVYEFGTYENNQYYTMRFIDGPNLSEVLHHDSSDPKDELSTQERRALAIANQLAENWQLQVNLIGQAADAIAHAHQRGILHRDVKPANMLIDESMKLWVTDFGLAKLRAEDPRNTARSKVMGTPRYMAPEQIRGEADERSDIFGLGLAFYEMTLLQKSGANRRQPIWKGGLRPPREYNPNVPPRLEKIIMKAVALDSTLRHRSVDDFIKELDAYSASAFQPAPAVAAEPPSHRLHLDDGLAKERSLAAKFGLAACGLLAFLAFAVWLFSDMFDEQQFVAANDQQSVAPEAPAESIDVMHSAPLLVNEKQSAEQAAPFSATPVDDNRETQLAAENQSPSFAAQMFEPDGRTILLDESAATFPFVLEFADDEDAVYDGLHISIIGGADSELFAMTPQGVLAFVRPVTVSQPLDSDSDNVYELDVQASDRTSSVYIHAEQNSSGKISLTKSRLVSGPKLESQILVGDVEFAEGLIDIATADGKTFFHLHRDSMDTAALYRSVLDEKGIFATTLLQSNCGIEQEAVGFATLDGVGFVYALPTRKDSKSFSLRKSQLDAEGHFSSSVLIERSGLPTRITGLSWLDGNRFQHVRPTTEETSNFYFSFLGKQRLVHMPLSIDESQFAGNVIGQAAWVEHAADSNTTIRSIRIKLVNAK